MSYLDPKADVTFKRVFGDPEHKGRCISLLNALLPLGEGREVVDIKFKPGAAGGNRERDRWLRLLTEINNRDEIVAEDLATEEPTRDAVECLRRASYSREQLLGYE